MCNISLFVTLCLFAAGFAQHDHGDHKVEVTVYYESLCPDSIAFITKQLHPALQDDELKLHVNLTLVPYGKSTTETSGGETKFTCHHGPKECEGNKLHVCGLKLIDNGHNTDRLGYNVNSFEFVNCLLSVKRNGDATEFPVKECSEKAHIRNMADIQNCAGSVSGTQFLANAGVITDAFQKPLKSVPVVVFNKEYDETVSAEAQKDFTKSLCKLITHDKPAVCKNGSSSVAPSAIGIISLLLFALCKVF